MMTAPRLEIDLQKIEHNARTLVRLLAARGISVTGITKATLGSAEIAGALLSAGVRALGDSRIENIAAMRQAGIRAPMVLIRSPMLSQAQLVVAHADVSLNTELDVMSKLSSAAQEARVTHGVVVMIELGDLREGIMPADLDSTVRQILRFPNISLKGIGTNLACRSGVSPDTAKMSELSSLATLIEATFGLSLATISGGNSANIGWATSGAETGRINDLRLGEAILLGRETLHRQPIEGLHLDAITLVAEVIESKVKPSLPWGAIAQTAFGEKSPATDRGDIFQTILAIGEQDTDPSGLSAPPGIEMLGSSSDHLVVSGPSLVSVGSKVRFQLNYSAMLRAMTSPYVARTFSPSCAPVAT